MDKHVSLGAGRERPLRSPAATAAPQHRDGEILDNLPGLVHSATSDTGQPPIEVDRSYQRKSWLKRATITGARLQQQSLTASGFRTYPVMITLTYARPDSWRSRHVADFLKVCRMHFRRQGKRFHYCWVAELTKAGRVHFHVIVWMPMGERLPKPDRRGWWPHGLTRIEKVRNAVGYIAKYVSKESLEHSFPKGLRTHGRGGLTRSARVEMGYWRAPRWVRASCSSIMEVRRTVGGGFTIVSTGEWLPSPYLIFFQGGGIYLRLKPV